MSHARTERVTQAQRDTIQRLANEHDADHFIVDFDEDHDTWFFLTLFRDGRQVCETVVEADGREAD